MQVNKVFKVIKVIQYHKKFLKIIATHNFHYYIIVLKNGNYNQLPQENNSISVKGKYQIYQNQIEIIADELTVLKADYKKKFDSLQAEKNQRLYIRSEATKQVYRILTEKGLLPVQSPTITSKWVKGNTNPFKISYYGKERFLSISNMVYHQLMISNGMSDIFELGKLHREELSSGKMKLSEFTTLDISRSFCQIDDICSLFEELIIELWLSLSKIDLLNLTLIEEVRFDRINYQDLLKKSGQKSFTGSQLPAKCRNYLQTNFSSFVWVTNFDVRKRPFYTKSYNGISIDAQLWYRGKQYFAAGSEIETDIEKILDNMNIRGNDPKLYREYLSSMKNGFPPMAMIGMGFEMLLSHLFKESFTIDYAYFPRVEHGDFF
ncbi:amino acid--tRNA ligase-related protein [Enterococcus caccae]|uniref:Aminoacyl-transfer RNA synthetases class-II family profile domain-containing protein n=1 Tax=Enterococcus caccae ATCC BAA-1240 TaxID=1158612 RepID=R3TR94_9ENTE|nr:amino acid--tRNA ligase-related protein [Enterococcus caccae]EOL43658.1 hypothetical protein UC7_02988 [Enterococcus caccae ATCC BAA-1240]EOT67942.1 hypothetical protein I580_00324 [Enterococcus caccae ATCC BAA-1240]